MNINRNHIYIVLSALVMAVLFSLLMSVHKPFSWAPTLQTESKEPFGCKLFDKLMSRSLPLGYEVLDDLPDSLNASRDAILYSKYVIGSYSPGYENAEQEAVRGRKLYDFASKQGGKVVVAAIQLNMFNDSLVSSYGFEKPEKYYGYNYAYEVIKPLVEQQKECEMAPRRLTILSSRRSVYVNELLIAGNELNSSFSPQKHQALIDDQSGNHIAFVRRFKSGGEIYYVAAPLLFSNYAANDAQARSLIVELLSPLANRHVVRIMGKNKPEKKTFATNDEFSFIRKHPSLNAAFQLFLAVLILALLFYSRRRMRAIPLPPEEHNMTLDFAKTMGTFHYRRHNRKLLQKSAEEKEENEISSETK